MTVKRKARRAGPVADPSACAHAVINPRQCASTGGGPQLRAPSARDFTEDKQERFFEKLSETANIRQSAEYADVSVMTIWRWRRRFPSFEARWRDALVQGYAQLEMQLLAVAQFGERSESETTTLEAGKQTRATRKDVPAFGYKLLQAHQNSVREHAIASAANPPAPEGVEALVDVAVRLRARITAPGGDTAA